STFPSSAASCPACAIRSPAHAERSAETSSGSAGIAEGARPDFLGRAFKSPSPESGESKRVSVPQRGANCQLDRRGVGALRSAARATTNLENRPVARDRAALRRVRPRDAPGGGRGSIQGVRRGGQGGEVPRRRACAAPEGPFPERDEA